jgi:hypothetical protein
MNYAQFTGYALLVTGYLKNHMQQNNSLFYKKLQALALNLA